MIGKAKIPFAGIVLITIMGLIWFTWQINDGKRLASAVEYYKTQSLFKLEWQNYVSHLFQRGQSESAKALDALAKSSRKQEANDHTIATLIQDLSFTDELRKTDVQFWGSDVYSTWYDSRIKLNEKVGQISKLKYGFIPQQHRPLTLMTYAFLHCNSWHWLLSSFMLLMVTVLLEQKISSFTVFISFCVASISVGIGLMVLTQSPWEYWPIVGSTGSTLALVGMYFRLAPDLRYGATVASVALILEAIRLYWIAPLPVLWPWIVSVGTTIAVFLTATHYLRHWLPVTHSSNELVQGEMLEDSAIDDDDNFYSELDQYYRHLAAFNFDTAREKLLKLEQNYPDRLIVMEQRYHFCRLTSDATKASEQFLKIAQINRTDRRYIMLMHELYQDYCHQPDFPSLPDSLLMSLMLSFAQFELWDTLKAMIELARERGLRDPMILKVLLMLARGIEKQDEKLSSSYRNMAASLERQLKDLS